MPSSRFLSLKKFPQPIILSFVIFLSFFILYSLNISSQVINHADSAELITAAYFRGLAHPPGYPLYILLLFLVTHLPFSNPYHLAHLSSAFLQSLNLTLFFLISFLLLHRIFPHLKTQIANFSSSVSACIVGFSFFFLQQATFAEVFPLHLLFVNIVILLSLFFPHRWRLLFFILGISFSHHQTSLLLLPAVLFIVILKSCHQPWLSYFFLFLIGVATPYLLGFIFLNPSAPISWQFTPTPAGLLELISRSVYQPNNNPTFLLLSPLSSAWHSTTSLFTFLVNNFAPISVIFMLIGLATLIFKDRRLLTFFLLLLIITGPFLAYYLKFDQLVSTNQEFYLYTLALSLRQFQLFFYLTAFLIPIGITSSLIISHRYAIHLRITQIKHWTLVIPPLLFIPLIIFSSNYHYTHLIHPEFDTQFSQSLLQHLPNESILIVDSDYAFTLIATQSISQIRPDVLILPTAMHMRWGYLQSILPPHIYRITGLRELALELTKWGIDQDRPVFSFHLRPELQQQLALFGYTLTPQGYTHQIALSPHASSSFESSLLNRLNQPSHPLDYWRQFLHTSFSNLTKSLTASPSSSPDSL